MINFFRIVLFIVIITGSNVLLGQADDLYYSDEPNLKLKEGYYHSYESFLSNDSKPFVGVERRREQVYRLDDSLGWVDASDRIWGYSNGSQLYLRYEEKYWKVLNLGTLAHFSAVVLTEYVTMDSFGFPVTRQTREMQQLFMDMSTGIIYPLSKKNLLPFLEKEPMLMERANARKGKRTHSLISVLQAYNQLNPLK